MLGGIIVCTYNNLRYILEGIIVCKETNFSEDNLPDNPSYPQTPEKLNIYNITSAGRTSIRSLIHTLFPEMISQ